jgi:hypothetical protein
MGAATKRRRKLVIDGETFLWSIHDDDVSTLHVVSPDKRLHLRYGWQHANPDGESFVDVRGERFVGLPPGISSWVRIQAPDWREDPSFHSPRLVPRLLQWALAPKSQVVYKQLPAGFSTHVLTAAPWTGGIPTFSSSPGQVQTYSPAIALDQ